MELTLQGNHNAHSMFLSSPNACVMESQRALVRMNVPAYLLQ